MIYNLIDEQIMKIDQNYLNAFKNTLINQEEITAELLNFVKEN